MDINSIGGNFLWLSIGGPVALFLLARYGARVREFFLGW